MVVSTFLHALAYGTGNLFPQAKAAVLIKVRFGLRYRPLGPDMIVPKFLAQRLLSPDVSQEQ